MAFNLTITQVIFRTESLVIINWYHILSTYTTERVADIRLAANISLANNTNSSYKNQGCIKVGLSYNKLTVIV